MTVLDTGSGGAAWSTSSFSAPADTSPLELSRLGDHLDSCRQQGGRLSTLHCAAQAVERFVRSRLVTSLALAATVAGLAWLLL